MLVCLFQISFYACFSNGIRLYMFWKLASISSLFRFSSITSIMFLIAVLKRCSAHIRMTRFDRLHLGIEYFFIVP